MRFQHSAFILKSWNSSNSMLEWMTLTGMNLVLSDLVVVDLNSIL